MRALGWVVFATCVVVACGLPKDSVVCGPSGTNACPTNQLCDTALGCVECLVDGDCPSTLFCSRGACVECVTDDDCSAPDQPACWADQQCHPACPATACPADMPVCDGNKGSATYQACRGCATSSDCTDPSKPHCETTLGECVECVSSSDCSGTTPHCFLGESRCVACTRDSDCAAGKTCDPQTLSCK